MNKKLIIILLNSLLVLSIFYLTYSIVSSIIFLTADKEVVAEKLDRIPTVEVLNGCGFPRVADKFTNLLRSKNFDVVKIGNFTTFDVDSTFVIDRVGNKKYALAVADSLNIPQENVIQHFNKNYFLDVTFVIGKDFNNYIKR